MRSKEYMAWLGKQVEAYRAKEREAYEAYQDSGNPRCYSAKEKHEKMADALAAALRHFEGESTVGPTVDRLISPIIKSIDDNRQLGVSDKETLDAVRTRLVMIGYTKLD